jgi:aromatic-L-amino-acid/L-tryptophan decarboxylase
VATIGTTETAAVDPASEIGSLCLDQRIWLHVDAAYGGAMGLLPKGRHLMTGIEQADSIVINAHKWLFVPLDMSLLYSRRLDVVRRVFALTPQYLSGDATAGTRDYMDFSLQLGRRFRALKAWMVWRSLGRDGLVARLREHVRLARRLASWIESDPVFELRAPIVMAVVCFAARCPGDGAAADALNEELVEAVNRSRRASVTHTRLRGRIAVRVAFGNILTTEHHLEIVWASIRAALESLRAASQSECTSPPGGDSGPLRSPAP